MAPIRSPVKRKREDDSSSKKTKRHRSKTELSSLNKGAKEVEADVTETTPAAPQTHRAVAQEPATNGVATVSIGKKNRKSKSKDVHLSVTESSKAVEHEQSLWKVLPPMGGRMANVDPVLTEDERFLILTYNTSIQIYSANDSLLVRKIPIPLATSRSERIVATRLSITNAKNIWVASSRGRLWEINWKTGAGASSSLNISDERVSDMTVLSLDFGKAKQDVIIISQQVEQGWRILACDIKRLKLYGTTTLFLYSKEIHSLRLAGRNYALAAASKTQLILGFLKSGQPGSFSEISYDFHVIDSADEITCLDLRVVDRIQSSEGLALGDSVKVVDVAFGCARGSVFYYSDILQALRQLQSPGHSKRSLQPRHYHWHPRAVHCIVWSEDGNYIVSGGSERVLLQRQLDTGKNDYLPHMSASIENLVVSSRGSSYIIHLDDNSALILSIAEMKPTTYISGIQTLVTTAAPSKDDLVTRVQRDKPHDFEAFRTAAALSPSDPSSILVSVGSGQHATLTGTSPSAPYVQKFDLSAFQSSTKQALTRANPTDVSLTRKGLSFTEPRVTRLAYSYDGKWLASVDEWQPPIPDMEPFADRRDDASEQSSQRREIYLKFWSSSAGDGSLELAARINAPHYAGRTEKIFDLAADPSSSRFATVGDDGAVRLWQPTIRQRDGIAVKNKRGEQSYGWSNTRVVYLEESKPQMDSTLVESGIENPRSGAVSFSEDGSAIVCAFGVADNVVLYIIDAQSGEIRTTLNGLTNGEVKAVEVLSSCVILLSKNLSVYDLVADELRYGVHLDTDLNMEMVPGSQQLAVDRKSQTFAIAASFQQPQSKHPKGELAIFSPDSNAPEMVQKLQYPITALLNANNSSGYIALDSAAQLWPVSPSSDTDLFAFAQPLADINLENAAEESTNEQNGNFTSLGQEDDAVSDDEMNVEIPEREELPSDEVYAAVVAPQKLAEIFDSAPSFAMPPIEEMFYQVTKLFVSKPLAAA